VRQQTAIKNVGNLMPKVEARSGSSRDEAYNGLAVRLRNLTLALDLHLGEVFAHDYPTHEIACHLLRKDL
jgi:hypothetical protein